MFLALTPEKRGKMGEEMGNLSTVQKKSAGYGHSSIGEIRLCERGLKRLAYEAFAFVSSQKRTTYKEVAKRLISQLSGDY